MFRQQIEAFRKLLMTAGPDQQQQRDIDYMLSMGELFTLIVYGHLILEKALMEDTDPDLLNQMFDVFVRDFSVYATELYGKPGNSETQRTLIRDLIHAPVADPCQFERVWQKQVYSLKDQYRMPD